MPDNFHCILLCYFFQAENPAGQATCTAELIVEAPSGREESVSPSPPVSRSPSVGTSPAPLYHTAIPPQFTRVCICYKSHTYVCSGVGNVFSRVSLSARGGGRGWDTPSCWGNGCGPS